MLMVILLTLVPSEPAHAQRVRQARVALVQQPRPTEALAMHPVSPAAEASSALDSKVARGALVGGLIGGVVAAVATFVVIESDERDFGMDGIYYSIVVPIGVGVGLVAGAIVGSMR